MTIHSVKAQRRPPSFTAKEKSIIVGMATYARTREQAHELIDRMAPSQVSAVVRLLETMLDPVARSLANAPFEDEPISDEENLAVAAAKEWLKHNDPIPHKEVLAEFGLTAEDFDRMGRTPLEPNGTGQ